MLYSQAIATGLNISQTVFIGSLQTGLGQKELNYLNSPMYIENKFDDKICGWLHHSKKLKLIAE